MSEPAANTLEITVERTSDGVTLVVSGEIDLDTNDQLSAALRDVVTLPRVHLDLTSVEYMDSTGLRALLVARDEIEQHGGRLHITRASNIVHRLIEITGLAELLLEPNG
jgi:anti-sigma B factor antagonist